MSSQKLSLCFTLSLLLPMIPSSGSAKEQPPANGARLMMKAPVRGEYAYAYAPSITKVGDTYYAFYCSTPEPGRGWDAIRLTTSKDRVNWTKPVVIMEVTNNDSEQAVCDPSLVRFDVKEGSNKKTPYFYLYYSGAPKKVGTAIFVSRAKSITGPYLKYTTRKTWEKDPYDPAPLIRPARDVWGIEQGDWYGAGQQVVINRNGVLHMWYNDDSTAYPEKTALRTYKTTSVDGIRWSKPVWTGLALHSPDIKWNPAIGKFIQVAINNAHKKDTSLIALSSVDGIKWSAPRTLIPEHEFPDYAHNLGISGDLLGNLSLDSLFAAYGSPSTPDYTNECCWGKWDLYSNDLSLNVLNGL